MKKIFTIIVLFIISISSIRIWFPAYANAVYDDGKTVLSKSKLNGSDRADDLNSLNSLNSSDGLNGLPVLMYHFFFDKSKGEKGADGNWLEIKKFEEQMKYLHDKKYYLPAWSEVASYVKGKTKLPKKSVVITIDDGHPSLLSLAKPILIKYNIKATSFSMTKNVKKNINSTPHNTPYIEYQSHTHDMHRRDRQGKGVFISTDYKTAYNDLIKSKKILNSADAFAYPFGHYNNHAVKVLKAAGFKLAFTTEYAKVRPKMNRYKLPRIRISAEDSLNSFIAKVK